MPTTLARSISLPITPVELRQLTKEELDNEGNIHLGCGGDPDSIPRANRDIIHEMYDGKPYHELSDRKFIDDRENLYITVTVVEEVAWEPAEGGYPIRKEIEKASFRIDKSLDKGDLEVLRMVVAGAYYLEYPSDDFSKVDAVITFEKPYASLPYFGYC